MTDGIKMGKRSGRKRTDDYRAELGYSYATYTNG